MTRLRAAGCAFAEDEARLISAEAGSPTVLEAMLQRRVSGEPLEQILGWAQFCGRRVSLDPGVFVPRRRTEFLARQAIAAARPRTVVVDLCCGSGAVAAAVSAAVRDLDVHAVDIDPAAVACARRNLPASSVYLGDLFGPLPIALRGRIGVLIANAPYVPTGALALMPPEAREHEARVALDGGPDGLDVHRRVATGAAGWLAPVGVLLVETSAQQAPAAAGLFAAHGMPSRVLHSDAADATVVEAGVG